MKTLLFTLEYPPFKGGIAKYYSDVKNNWPEPDSIYVLNSNENQLISKFGWPKWRKAIKVLHREIKNKNINHVLVGQVLPLGTVAWLVQKTLKFQYSIFIHGLDINFSQRSWRKKLLTKIILKNASNIICISSYGARIIEELLPSSKNKIKIIHPAVEYPNLLSSAVLANEDQSLNPNRSLVSKLKSENKLIIFSIGRLVKRKGFDMMIKAMPKILDKIPNVSYIIAGTGPDEEYLNRLSESRGRNYIPPSGNSAQRLASEEPISSVQDRQSSILDSSERFIGKISEEDKWVWLKACDVFVTPCRDIDGDTEGFGIVFLEANLAGKPVIAGRSGGVTDAVIDYETGILVDPNSVDDIAEGVIELLRKPQLRHELGEQGMRRALEKFDVKQQVKNLHKIITK